jgi:hypothetical protein
MYARMDAEKINAMALYGSGDQQRSEQGGGGVGGYAPVAQQVGGKVGSLIAAGIGPLLGGGFKAPGTSFWPAASNVGSSTWQTGFSLGGSLLK